MKTTNLLAASAAFSLALSLSANATTLYDNLGAASGGSDFVGSSPPPGFGGVTGPLADSFSTPGTNVGFNDLKLLLSGDNTVGGITTVELLSDNATSPGSVLDTLGAIDNSSLSSTLSVVELTFAPIDLNASTRYWIELVSGDPSNPDTGQSSALWSWSLDTSGTGVASEFFSNANAVFSNPDNGPYQMQINAVPEPLTLSLVGAGLLGATALRRRKKRAA